MTRKQLGVDLDTVKAYGPRVESGNVAEGESPILNGRDRFFDDAAILRLVVSSLFDVERTMFFMKYHLEWRQTSVPLPVFTDKTSNLLKLGILYIHGRAKDMSPILIFDFVRLQHMLDNELIDTSSFCQLHAFMGNYISYNMLLPG